MIFLQRIRPLDTPGSLGEVLSALEQDHVFLLRGDVFTPDVIEAWIRYKREKELAQVNLRPTPETPRSFTLSCFLVPGQV
jgi:glutamine synthetase